MIPKYIVLKIDQFKFTERVFNVLSDIPNKQLDKFHGNLKQFSNFKIKSSLNRTFSNFTPRFCY